MSRDASRGRQQGPRIDLHRGSGLEGARIVAGCGDTDQERRSSCDEQRDRFPRVDVRIESA